MSECKSLTVDQAWSWAREHGFPGIPLSGYSLDVEHPGSMKGCSLRNQGGEFSLYHAQGVSLEHGKCFATSSGHVTRVILAFPGSSHPFEGEHTGLRYMSDGRQHRRYYRLASSSDLVAPATKEQVARYEDFYACYPTQSMYEDTAARMGGTGTIASLSENVPSYVVRGALSSMRDATPDRATQRCAAQQLEALRLVAPPSPVLVCTDLGAFTRMAMFERADFVLDASINTVPLLLLLVFMVAIQFYEQPLVVEVTVSLLAWGCIVTLLTRYTEREHQALSVRHVTEFRYRE